MATPVQVTVDSADPHAQARFWAAALGYEVEDHSGLVAGLLETAQLPMAATTEVDGRIVFADLAACADPDGRGPRLLFQHVPEAKVGKNRLHLDLHVGSDAREAEVARLQGLGARVLHESWDRGPVTTTLADPEGNEFCVE